MANDNQVPFIGAPLIDPRTGQTNVQWWRFFARLGQTITAMALTLQTNGVANALQTLLNLVAGANILLTSDSKGNVTIASTLVLATNGAVNIDQTRLNLAAGSGVTLTADNAGDVTIAATGGGSGGGVNKQTANYTAVAGDTGKLISFSSSNPVTGLTLTLPAPPSATWNARVENAGIYSSSTVNGELTVQCPAGVSIDGGAAGGALVMCIGQGIYITTDGTNYYTERGGPIPGSTVAGNTTGGVAVLTLSKSDTGGGKVLDIITRDGSGTAVSIVVNPISGIAGVALDIIAGTNDGVNVTCSSGVYGGVPVRAMTGSGKAVVGRNSSSVYPCADFSNSFTGGIKGPDIQLTGSLAWVPGTTVANLGNLRWANGLMTYCSDAMSILDGAAAGSVAVGGGTGSMVAYLNSSWRIMC
jgi:hypothetical protein